MILMTCLTSSNEFLDTTYFKNLKHALMDNVMIMDNLKKYSMKLGKAKNGIIEEWTCGRQPLINLKWYSLLRETISLQIF